MFFDGGNIGEASAMAAGDNYNGYPIGNTVQLADENMYSHLKFNIQYNSDGSTKRRGGVTQDFKSIVMNRPLDTKMNRLHEIFHTLGFTHPEGGGKQGIMKYPPKKPTKKDALEISNSKFLPSIIKSKK